MRLRHLIFAALVLASCSPMGKPWGEEDSNIVRSYHLDRSGLGSSNLCDTSIGCPTLGIYFDDAVAGTYVTEIGSYTMTVNGNPTRVAAGTWPAGFSGSPGYAWRMDGTGDYLSLADAAGAFAPPGAWSVVCGITPRAGFASGDVFAAKWNTTGNKRSWRLYTGGTSVVLDISSDGAAGTIVTLTKATALAAGRRSWITASCDGAGNCSIWVDGLTVATSAVMPDPFVGDAALTFGADAEGAGDVPAQFAPCAFYNGSISAATHARMAARWAGLYDGSGTQVVSVTNASPPAIQVAAPADGVSPFLVDQPANTTMLGKTASCSGIYGPSAVSNRVQYASFETGAALTGWTVANAGTTGACAQSCISPVHGSCEAACSTADADDEVTVTSACLTVTGGTAMWLSAWLKTSAGAGLVDLNVIEDDSADCGSPTTTTAVVNDAVPTATWARYGAGITLQAGTIRAKVQVSLPAAAAQTTFADAVQFRTGTYSIDAFCPAPSAATGVCATSVTSHVGALPANPGTVELTACTPWAGTDATVNMSLLVDGAVAAANTVRIYVLTATDEIIGSVYDSAPVERGLAPNTSNWSASTPYMLRYFWDGFGNMGITWPVGTWYDTTAGAGTGIRSAAQAVTYLCGTNSVGYDVWLKDIRYFRGVLK